MSNYIKQKDPQKLKYVDEDLLVDKTGRRAFKGAAYSVGIAIGFLILSPLLPSMGSNEEQSAAIISEFRSIAFWMIGYSIAVTIGFFFFRSKIKTILMALNWVIMPIVVLAALLEIKDIMTGS